MGVRASERARGSLSDPRIEDLAVDVLTIPTASDESDGTLAWHETTMVLVQVHGGGTWGVGYTYGAAAAARVVEGTLREAVRGQPIMDVERCMSAMLEVVRNDGRRGIAAHAISAVDIALWDLKARVLGVSLADLVGLVRSAVPLYGSGGFTSYDERQLARQLVTWAEAGLGAVKMKVGRHPEHDPSRVSLARSVVGPTVELRVDANGAYQRKQAMSMAHRFAEHAVTWFEEPVSSEDLNGLAWLRRDAPPGMRITAGEYAYDHYDVQRLLRAEAVDVLQLDATRCLGLTGFVRCAALCEASSVPVSCHTAPSVHAVVACACPAVLDVEWFFDHVRIEQALFAGALEPEAGMLRPDRSQLGLGLEPKPRALEQLAS